jgi:hypothetical protein
VFAERIAHGPRVADGHIEGTPSLAVVYAREQTGSGAGKGRVARVCVRKARVPILDSGEMQPVPEVIQKVFNFHLERGVEGALRIHGLASLLGFHLADPDAIGQVHDQLILALVNMPLYAVLGIVVLAEVGAGVKCHALVQVRVAEACRVAFDLDARRLELAGVEDEFAQKRLLGQDVERRLSRDLARTKAA